MHFKELKGIINDVYHTFFKVTSLDLGKHEKIVDKCWGKFEKRIIKLAKKRSLKKRYIKLEEFFIKLGVNKCYLVIENEDNDLLSIDELYKIDVKTQKEKLESFIYIGLSYYLQSLFDKACGSDLMRKIRKCFESRTKDSDDITHYATIKRFCNSSNKEFNNYIDKRIEELLE
jgi:hypothetical protein